MQQFKTKSQQQTNVIPFIPNGDFYYTKGVQAFKKRKFESALKWLKKAVEAAPDNPLYNCQLSVVYTEMGSYQEANKLLSHVINVCGEDYIDCYYLMANNYAHLGFFNDAKDCARFYIEKEPEGDFSEEAFALIELLEMGEEDDDYIEDDLLIYRETIFHYMENMEWDKALPLLEEATVLFPEHQTVQHDIAMCLFNLGREDEAIKLELTSLNRDPDSLYSVMNLAVFYYQQNQLHEYEKYISALLNVYPVHEHQKLRLATTLAKTGWYQCAYNRYQSLMKEMVSSHISYYRWFSLAAYQMGNYKKARSIWEEGCHKHPNLQKEAAPWLI